MLPLKPALQTQSETAILPTSSKKASSAQGYATSVALATGWRVPKCSEDDFKKAIEVVRKTQKASVSHFQRKLGYGYNHAAALMDRLEAEGYIGPQSGTGPRKINWERFSE